MLIAYRYFTQGGFQKRREQRCGDNTKYTCMQPIRDALDTDSLRLHSSTLQHNPAVAKR